MAMNEEGTPLLVIGLDTGCGRLIRELAEAGRLPVLRSLAAAGSWRRLGSTSEWLHVSSWPSIYTGAHPGEHGVYYTHQPAPGLQGFRHFGKRQYGRPTFWNLLAGQGRRIAVFDAIYTHPEPGFRGVQLFEWGTWAHYWKPMSVPAPWMRRLRRARGAYPLGMEAHRIGLDGLDAEQMGGRLEAAARAKTEAALWLLGEGRWDLFFVTYGETHPGAHYCWPPVAGGSSAALAALYAEIDRGIGRLVDAAGPRAAVMVLSGEGVGPNYGGWHLLPALLERLGFTAAPGGPAKGADAGPGPGGKPEGGGGGVLKKLLPKGFRKAIASRLPHALRDAINRRMAAARIDWSNSAAYTLPTDLEGCIRINLKGREPQGIVEPGAAYERVCAEIAQTLRALRLPGGGPAVREVARVDDLFPGGRRAWLPDLIVLWTDGAAIEEIELPGGGRVRGATPDRRTGTHRPPGFALLSGPGIPAGVEAAEGHVIDVAPTVLARFGCPPGAWMKGRVWKEAVGT